MSLADILSGLGGIGEGYLKGTNQLQQLQSNQYANALRALALQQQIQGGGAAWQALQQNPNLMGQPGGQLGAQLGSSSMAPGQIQTDQLPPLPTSQASQPSLNLPQVPNAAQQMTLGAGTSGVGDLLYPNLAGKNVNWQGETPQFQTAVSDMLQAMPADLRSQASVDSGFRTREQQQDAYDRYQKGEISLAAAPGTSRHEIGQAADWNTSSPAALNWMRQNAGRFGLDFPLGNKDPDHMQLLAQANQTVTQLKQATPPPVQQAAQAAALPALRSFGNNPLSQIGQHDPSAIITAIDKANPGAPDFIKFSAFHQLYPLLTNAGKVDFAQAIQLMKFGQQDTRIAQAEQRLRDYESKANQPTGAIYQPADEEGKPVGPPGQAIGGVFKPLQGLPAGAGGGLSRVGPKSQQQTIDPETVDASAKAIAEYRLPPLTGWTLRSPWGQAVNQKLFQYNPDYSAPQYAAGVSGQRAFTTGKQADQVRSMSVAVDHLQVAEDLGKALQTGDSRGLNTITQELKKQFGYEGPVDFDVSKMIVGDEVTKAIAGGTLSMTERMSLQDQFSKASSPEQMVGVATTLKRLLGGQLRGLERQYEAIPGQKQPFEQKLSPQAKEQLGGHPAPTTPAPDFSTMDTNAITKWLQDNP